MFFRVTETLSVTFGVMNEAALALGGAVTEDIFKDFRDESPGDCVTKRVYASTNKTFPSFLRSL